MGFWIGTRTYHEYLKVESNLNKLLHPNHCNIVVDEVLNRDRSEQLLGIWEIASFAGVISLLFWVVATSLAKASIIPINDPYLVETIPKLKNLKFKSE